MEIKEFDYETTFPPLGHSEHHFNKYPNHPWLKTKADIEDWLLRYLVNVEVFGIKNENMNDVFEINDDLTVDVKESVNIDGGRVLAYIPIKFRKVDGCFLINNSELKNFIGSPDNCEGVIYSNSKVQSFLGVGKNISSFIDVDVSNLESFVDIIDFKNEKLTIRIKNSPICSWGGFDNIKTNIKQISLDYCNVSNDFVIKTPKNIMKLVLIYKYGDIPFQIRGHIDWTGGEVDMNWLRNWQIEQELKKVNNEIDGSLENIINNENKKRKL